MKLLFNSVGRVFSNEIEKEASPPWRGKCWKSHLLLAQRLRECLGGRLMLYTRWKAAR